MIENTIKQFRFKRQVQKDRLGTQSKTKQTLGLAERRVSETRQSTMEQVRSMKTTSRQYDPSKAIMSWVDEYDALKEERANSEESTTGALSEMPSPRARYENSFTGTVVPSGDLKTDESFINAVSNLAEKRGISVDEIYSVIKGESAFNPRAQNPSGATGLFQFMPATAEELGVSTDQIMNMSPVEQVQLYDKYLDRWNYNSDNRLGIMQAAPAFADRSPEAVIYPVGSAAWKQNKGWRELGDGPITVRSINSYYSRQS